MSLIRPASSLDRSCAFSRNRRRRCSSLAGDKMRQTSGCRTTVERSRSHRVLLGRHPAMNHRLDTNRPAAPFSVSAARRIGGRAGVSHDHPRECARACGAARAQQSDHPGGDRHRAIRDSTTSSRSSATTACNWSPSATPIAKAPATGTARSAAASRPGGWSTNTTPRKAPPRLTTPATPIADFREILGRRRYRRRRNLHSRPLARAHGRRGVQGQERHLLPEAAFAHGRRRPRDELRGQPVEGRLPDRQPAALGPPVPPRRRAGPQWP